MTKLLIIIILLGLTNCVSKPLSPQEKAVRILRKSDAPANCNELKPVHAPGLASITDKGRENDLKKAAFAAGGDTVAIVRQDENRTIFGIAYKCNN